MSYIILEGLYLARLVFIVSMEVLDHGLSLFSVILYEI